MKNAFEYKNISISEFCIETNPCIHNVSINGEKPIELAAVSIAEKLYEVGLCPKDNFMSGHFNEYLIETSWKKHINTLFDSLIKKNDTVNNIINSCLAHHAVIVSEYNDIIKYDRYRDNIKADSFISYLISTYIIEDNDIHMFNDFYNYAN